MRRRLKRYTYGHQWDDVVRDATGTAVTEWELMTRSGRQPITHNLLRGFVKTVVGRFRYSLAQQPQEQDETAARNMLDELDARALEEFLISGCAVQRIVRERRPEGYGVWVDNVSPATFFCNRFHDIRGGDVQLLGMLHEMSLTQVLMRHSHGSRYRAKMIREAFDRASDQGFALPDGSSPLGFDKGEERFSQPSEPGLCRLIEVWTLEVDRKGTTAWHCRYYAPDGTKIDETDSPYAHGSHPFVFKFYPLTDGEVHPFIEDILDQQRYINRLINVIDHIMSSSAKGVLLFPVDSVPKGYDLAQVISQWNQPGGVIPIDSRASRMPQQVEADGSAGMASSLLETELKLIQQISGVSGVLQGQGTGSVMNSATLYQAQLQNSAIALQDIYDTFHSFRRSRDLKLHNV